MLMNTEVMNERLSSPDNLLNRLREFPSKKKDGVELFTGPIEVLDKPNSAAVFEPPSIDDLIEDAGNKLEVGSAHNGALRVRATAIGLLEKMIVAEVNPAKLSKIATEMSRVAGDIRGEVLEKKSNNIIPIIFKPMFVEESHYTVINVSD